MIFYQDFTVAFACLLYIIEKIRKMRDSKGVFVAVFTYLSKTFDCISHELRLAKLHAYGFDKILLNFMHAYLSQRQNKTKAGSTFSDLMSFFVGVPKHLSYDYFYL